MAKVTIERMSPDDVAAVMTVDQLCFPTPWSENAYRSELGNVNAYYLVARLSNGRGERLIGFAGAWIVMDEMHITTIGVHPAYRRQGIGDQLFSALMEEAVSRGVRRASLEVRESNRAAQSLYESYGFVPIARRRQYYTDTGEDAIVMWVENLGTSVQAFRRAGIQDGERRSSAHPNTRTPERLNA
jgi:ribosomal-protein-alanine N-acetyltransferase